MTVGAGVRSVQCILLAGVLACGPAAPPEGPHLVWHADALAVDNPLPDDRLLVDGRPVLRPGWYLPYLPAATHTGDAFDHFDAYGGHLGTLAGWGTLASVLVPASEALDPETLRDRFIVVPRAGGAPTPLRPQWRAQGYVELELLSPLEPETTYAVVAKRGLAASGSALVPAPEYWRWSREEGRGEHEALAAAAGLPPEEVLLAFTFTTMPVRRDLQRMVERVAAHGPEADLSPTAVRTRWPYGVFAVADFVAALPEPQRPEYEALLAYAGTIVVGRFASLDFRSAEGVLDPERVSGAAAPEPAEVEFVLVEPDAARFPPPWPVVLVQHGFGGSVGEVFLRAEFLAENGIAAIGLDALGHGPRGSLMSFFSPEDMRVARDNLRQTVIDQILLCRLATEGALDFDGVAGPDLQGPCDYLGQSMGGVLGGLHAAVSPGARVSVLNVGGGGLTRILSSPNLSDAIKLLLCPALGISVDEPAYADVLPFYLWVSQTLVEEGDPLNYAALVRRAPPASARYVRSVLLQAGVGDPVVPNRASADLAAALGLPVLEGPAQDPGGAGGLWWVDLADHGQPDGEPHNILWLVEGVQQQAARFFLSGGTEIVDPQDW